MPHKTLLIGLGSSGAEIVSEVMDRVVARFGSMEAAPWVEVVAFDTDKIRNLTIAGKNSVHVGLDSKAFRDFVQNPASLASIEFERWSDREPFQSNSASDKGASNVRMIGRASMLHPKVFVKVHGAIKSRLDRLRAVNLSQAAQAAKLPSQEASDAVRVFVCGSLTGGTCSGSFIDLGYYLREYGERLGLSISSYGVFGMPHPQGGTVRHRANAYQAIQELNHYLTDGAHYRQAFPLPSVFPSAVEFFATPPYQSSLLLMPAGADTHEFQLTYIAAAEYLYTAACTSMADDVYKRIVDPAGSLFGVKSRGRHMNFQSLGAATLEFPADHIGKGAAARLIGSALQEWLDAPGMDPGLAVTLLNTGDTIVTREDIHTQLLRRGSGQTNVEDAIDERLKAAQNAAARGELGALKTATDQIEEGFAVNPGVPGGIGPRAVLTTIEQNKVSTTETVLHRLERRIERALYTLEEGPNWCRGLAEAILRRVEIIRDESTNKAAHERSEDRLRTVREKAQILDEVNRSALLGALGFKKAALAKCAEDWYHAARAYYAVRVDDACGIVEKDQLESLRLFANRVIHRLEGHELSLIPVAQKIRAAAEKEYETKNTGRPSINGEATFEPEKTIPAEYKKTFETLVVEPNDRIRPSRLGEEYARAAILLDWPLLEGALTAAPDQSAFDARTTQEEDEQSSDTQIAMMQLDFVNQVKRRYFGDLWTRNVLVELFGTQSNPSGRAIPTIQRVREKARALVDVNDNYSPLGPVQENDLRKPCFAFFYNAKADVFPYQQVRDELANILDPANNVVATTDPTKVLILQGRTTFAAGDIEGIESYKEFHNQAQNMGQARLESRSDVVWRTLDGKPLHPDLEHAMQLFLFGIATGVIENHHLPDQPFFVAAPNEAPLRLPLEIEMAGFQIATKANGLYRLFLDRRFREAAAPEHRPILLKRLDDMMKQHDTLFPSLRYRYAPVQNATGATPQMPPNFVRDSLMRLIRTNTDLFRAYNDGGYLSEFLQTPERYLLTSDMAGKDINGRLKPDGYYCPNCKTLLKPAHSPTNLPEICPKCEYSLLMPGYYEIMALKAVKPGESVVPAVTPPPSSPPAPMGNF